MIITNILCGSTNPTSPRRADALSQFTDVLQKRFEVVGALGDGSFSEVLKVRENETGRTYALKNVKKPNKNTLTEFFCAAELGGSSPWFLGTVWVTVC
jgi:serine/threonine protein kinase